MASLRFVLGVALSGGLHVLAYVQMSHAKGAIAVRPSPPVVVEVDTAAPPPPPPPPPTSAPDVAGETVAPTPTHAAATRAPKAQASRVVSAAEDAQPSAMADFTMVQGDGASYAGGVTTSAGTSRAASNALAAPAAGPAARGTAAGARSGRGEGKPARPVGDDWDCSALYPRGASVGSATVVIVVRVSAKGTAESVSVLKDPGQGFAEAARLCATRQRYAAAEDPDGTATAATTAPFRVRFTR